MNKWTKVIKANEENNDEYIYFQDNISPEEQQIFDQMEIDRYMNLLLEGNHIFDEDREILKNEKDKLEQFLKENLDNIYIELHKHPLSDYEPLHEYDMGPDQQLYEDGFDEVKYIIDEYKKWKKNKYNI